MRPRRIREGNEVVFDAAKQVLKKQPKKVLLKMRGNQLSYETESGIIFYNAHPYQWVPKEEAEFLLGEILPEFVLAKFEDAEDFYSY